MNKFLLGVSALMLGLTFTGSTNAAEHREARRPHRVEARRPYYAEHGVRFGGGYYYRGYDHHHWAYRAWDPVHVRYQYWDPNLQCYYYWDPASQCYYPATYVIP